MYGFKKNQTLTYVYNKISNIHSETYNRIYQLVHYKYKK